DHAAGPGFAGKHQHAIAGERATGGGGADHGGSGARSEEPAELDAAVAGEFEGVLASGDGWRGAAGGACAGRGNRPAGRGGEEVPGFFAADGCAPGADTIGGPAEGSAGGGAAGAGAYECAGGAIDSDWNSGSDRGPGAAEAGDLKPGVERGGSDADGRAIAIDAEPARRDGGNHRG